MGIGELVSLAVSGAAVLRRPFVWLVRRLRGSEAADPGVGQRFEGDVASSAVAARDLNVGGNLTIQTTPGHAETDDQWWSAEGAPRFRMNPNRELNPFRLSMSFEVTADFQLNPMARWRGAGVAMDFVEPMRENRPGKFQMKPVPADPENDSDPEIPASSVGFEIAFPWRGKTRHALFVFSLEHTPKGWRTAQTGEQISTPARTWSE